MRACVGQGLVNISEQNLLNQFGAAVLTHNAALFVGAGMSRVAAPGSPDWAKLVEPFRRRARIPAELKDLPLVAQYFVQHPDGNREQLEIHVANELSSIKASNLAGHERLNALPVSEVWTTNYDQFLEQVMPKAQVVVRDEDLADRRTAWDRRIIKMHGSLDGQGGWAAPPVITRQDYERYEVTHPRMWAALTATFLTRSFLFLGFSFADPNVDILLRLARTRLELGGPEHFTVVRRPDSDSDRDLFPHRVRDLERSGVAVLEIDDHAQLIPLLGRLVRRTRPPRLFVSGSGSGIGDMCDRLGRRLADLGVEVTSLAGDAGMGVSYSLGRAMRDQGRYDPTRVTLLFRQKDERPPELTERTGTVVYSHLPAEQLRREAIDSSRALVVVGGGPTTAHEVEIADELGVPVVPIGSAGGTGHVVWQKLSACLGDSTMGGARVNAEDFARLGDPDAAVAVESAVRLLNQAMYLESQPAPGHL